MSGVDEFAEKVYTTRFREWNEVQSIVETAKWYHNFIKKENWILQDLHRQVSHGYKTEEQAIDRISELEKMARDIHDFLLDDVVALSQRLTQDSTVTNKEYRLMDQYILELASSYLRGD